MALRVYVPTVREESFTVTASAKSLGSRLIHLSWRPAWVSVQCEDQSFLHLYPLQDTASEYETPPGTLQTLALPSRMSARRDDASEGPTGRAARLVISEVESRVLVEVLCTLADSWPRVCSLVRALGRDYPEIPSQWPSPVGHSAADVFDSLGEPVAARRGAPPLTERADWPDKEAKLIEFDDLIAKRKISKKAAAEVIGESLTTVKGWIAARDKQAAEPGTTKNG